MRSSKEWVLNIAFNRWQFNRPRYVGRLSESIRACAPRTLEDWERYYFENVRPEGPLLGHDMREHLAEVARRLYEKIREELLNEIDKITEEDCLDYVHDVVIRRTFEGYVTEKKTIYEQLAKMLGVKILPAPDEWDRRYNVDFYIPVGNKAVGIQVKPITYQQAPEAHKWHEWMERSHARFQQEQGGKVFVVFSITEKGGRKRIWNEEVVEAIREELGRLRAEAGEEPDQGA
jgi:hypothetical protein